MAAQAGPTGSGRKPCEAQSKLAEFERSVKQRVHQLGIHGKTSSRRSSKSEDGTEHQREGIPDRESNASEGG